MLAHSQASFRVPSEFAGFPKTASISLRPSGVSIALSFLQSHVVERFPASIGVGLAVIPGLTKLQLQNRVDLPVIHTNKVLFYAVFVIKTYLPITAAHNCLLRTRVHYR